MSKFHSTVSRRAFMKGLGLAGAGLGAATATAPVFHDLDELTASKNAVRKLSWYVKEREFFDLTVEIDWPNKERYDKRNNVKVDSEESAKRIAECDRQYQQGVDIPGNTRRDHALWMGCYTRMSYTLGGETKALYHASGTAEELGLPRWEATPEENLRTLAAAIHLIP